MNEKIINIDGIEVKLKSNASILIRFKNAFGKDLMKELIKMQNLVDNPQTEVVNQLENIDIELFTEILWCMAKSADANIPAIDAWLSQFSMIGIINSIPEIMDLLVSNFKQEKDIKKN